MTTARLQSLDTTLIIFPDFQWPSPDFVEKYATIVEGVHSLAAYGISLDMVQDTMRWLRELPQIVLPSALDMPSVDAVVSKLVSRRHGQEEMKPVENLLSNVVCVEGAGNVNLHHVSPKALKKASQAAVVSIVDDTVQEALCAAFLLKEFLKEYFPLSEAGHVLGPNESLPETTTTLLVVCSNGCFQRPSFVRHLFEAEARGIGAVRSLLRIISSFHAKQCIASCGCFLSTFCRVPSETLRSW